MKLPTKCNCSLVYFRNSNRTVPLLMYIRKSVCTFQIIFLPTRGMLNNLSITNTSEKSLCIKYKGLKTLAVAEKVQKLAKIFFQMFSIN